MRSRRGRTAFIHFMSPSHDRSSLLGSFDVQVWSTWQVGKEHFYARLADFNDKGICRCIPVRPSEAVANHWVTMIDKLACETDSGVQGLDKIKITQRRIACSMWLSYQAYTVLSFQIVKAPMAIQVTGHSNDIDCFYSVDSSIFTLVLWTLREHRRRIGRDMWTDPWHYYSSTTSTMATAKKCPPV